MSAASASPSPAAGGKARAAATSMKTPIGGEDVCALVVQVGSCSVRVGYAQEDHPRIHATATVGRRRLRIPQSDSGNRFCGTCCCCESRAALAATPDFAADSSSSSSCTSSTDQQQQKQQYQKHQHRWQKSSGVSPSVFYNKGPFSWSPERRCSCSCSCSHPDLVFPVNFGVATPHMEVAPIISTGSAGTATGKALPEDSKLQQQQQQQEQQEQQLDREAFSAAVRICIEGHVTEEEAQRRTVRPPRKQQQQQQQPEGMKEEMPDCSCCCLKQGEQQQQQTPIGAPRVNGRCGVLLDGEAKEDPLVSCSSSNNSNSNGLFEAFGCSPFGGLGVWTHEHPILVVEPTLAGPSLRQSLAAAVFEDLQAPAAFFVRAAATAAFAMGRSSALVVELGSSGGSIAAVCDGYTLRRSIQSFNIGGAFMDRQIELVLLQHLRQQQERRRQQQQQQQQQKLLDFNQQQRLLFPLFSYAKGAPMDLSSCSSSLLQRSTEQLARQIREACCVVRSYADASLPLSLQGKAKGGAAVDTPEDLPPPYELPDGTLLDCSGIRDAVGEIFFQPKAAVEALQSLQPPQLRQNPDELLQGFTGLPSAVADCVYANDVDVRRDLLSAVILTGGVALTPGLAERFSDELHSEAFGPCNSHSGLKVRVVCPSSQTERQSAAWLGGSILASLGTFQEMWISKQEYEEHGSAILEKRAL